MLYISFTNYKMCARLLAILPYLKKGLPKTKLFDSIEILIWLYYNNIFIVQNKILSINLVIKL